jgi:hypothetical protein
LNSKEKLSDMTNEKNEKQKADVCQKFGLVNSMVQTIWKDSTKIISACQQNGSRIKQFWRHEKVASWGTAQTVYARQKWQSTSEQSPPHDPFCSS